jgi:hypothetical protein
MPNTGPSARKIDLDNSAAAVFDRFYEAGWTDGLPIIPPTPELVEAMLRYTDRDRYDVVAIIEPRGGEATVEKIAINAVMAGCKPEYLPVVITAVAGMAEPEYNLYGRQTTTHPGAHLVIINGPVRHELEVNCRQNVFGHGWRANATIGRAVRLVCTNIGGGAPGITDMATHGHPGRFSYCIGEDEENSPWDSLHVERGLEPGTSSVTVFCAEAPHNVNDQVSKTPEMYLESGASTMRHLGANGPYRSGIEGEQMMVLTAESAIWLEEWDWSKEQVRQFLFQQAQNPVGVLRGRGGWGTTRLPDFVDTDDDEAMMPIVPRPENILIVVAGGHGRHMNVVLSSAYNLSVTKPITRRDGTPVKSVREFVTA